MKKYISIILVSLLTVSCVDTVLLPDDKTVDEDFWKTKADVSLMVEGAYKSMLSGDVISRLIVWGDFRSDELLPVSSISSNATVSALTEIDAQNTQTDNMFSSWASLYSVINNCNIVLDRAQSVMSIDPSKVTISQTVHRCLPCVPYVISILSVISATFPIRIMPI